MTSKRFDEEKKLSCNIPIARIIGSARGVDNLISLTHCKEYVRLIALVEIESTGTNFFGGYHKFADFERAVRFE